MVEDRQRSSLDFRTVYDQHFPFVWRSLRQLGVSDADAADATQEVFMVVHRKLAEFEERSKITTWLFGICLRVASHRRRATANRREVFDEPLEERVDEDDRVDRGAERQDAARVLERVLSRMNLEQRAVFVLFELEGYSCEEIANIVGAPLGTVKSRLRLARTIFEEAAARLRAHDRFLSSEGVQ